MLFIFLVMLLWIPWSLFTYMACRYAKLLEQKDVFTKEKGSSPTVMVREINNAAFLLLCDTNMAEMTPCKNALFKAQEEFNRDSKVKSIAGRAFLRIPFWCLNVYRIIVSSNNTFHHWIITYRWYSPSFAFSECFLSR